MNKMEKCWVTSLGEDQVDLFSVSMRFPERDFYLMPGVPRVRCHYTPFPQQKQIHVSLIGLSQSDLTVLHAAIGQHLAKAAENGRITGYCQKCGKPTFGPLCENCQP